jgi:hypothetical protein
MSNRFGCYHYRWQDASTVAIAKLKTLNLLIALFHRSLASASLRKDLAEGTEGQGDPS